MKWNEYETLAERTLSTQFNCDKKDELLLHAVIGMLTEIDELLENYLEESDDINISEEIADVWWYLSIISREYSLTLPEKSETPLNDFDIILEVTKRGFKLLDFMKKKIYYNKPINETLFIQYSQEIMSLLVAYAEIKKVNIETSLRKNIEKLQARYPDKFNSQDAINRNLELERNILEK